MIIFLVLICFSELLFGGGGGLGGCLFLGWFNLLILVVLKLVLVIIVFIFWLGWIFVFINVCIMDCVFFVVKFLGLNWVKVLFINFVCLLVNGFVCGCCMGWKFVFDEILLIIVDFFYVLVVYGCWICF